MFKHKTRIGTRTMTGVLLAIVFATATLAACTSSSSPTTTTNQSSGINKIKHVIVIMQENRSFDTYFGTFPGADGIPMQNGVPTVCVPNPATHTCDKPYLNNTDKNSGGPHGQTNASADIDGGKMDGFI